MAASSRSSQFGKVHKVLKKLYKPVAPDLDRLVFEHLLFAGCLENAHYEAAEEAFAALVHNFFDWNEVRVSTVRELSEVIAGLPEPPAAANRLRRVLQAVFESTYSFDLEELRKLNLGPATERLRKIDGTTNFSIAYVVQSALGGHAIPVDFGVLRALYIVDLVTQEDVKQGVVPGMERAMAKSKGIEFGSLLHQLGADVTANPYMPALRETLLQINPDAGERLPKRRTKKQAEAAARRKRRRVARKQAARREARAEAEAEAAAIEKAKTRGGKKKGPAGKPARSRKKAAEAEAATPGKKNASPEEKAAPTVKKTPAAGKKESTRKKKTAAPKADPLDDTREKGSPASGLSKRKPR